MRWSVFARVVDNFGDIGFARRLVAELCRRGEDAVLVVDDGRALAWMDPGFGAASWHDADVARFADADVLVETFGGGAPEAVLEAAARRPASPLRIDVEHLTAEGYAARSHGLPSPARLDDGRPWPVWYFYPGFGADAGGLLRERDLTRERTDFDRDAWLRARGLERRPGERVVVWFGYAQPRWRDWLQALDEAAPTLLVVAAGTSVATLVDPRAAVAESRRTRLAALPFLHHDDFDRLLWSADLNLVRGEDSLVRAIWAGAPFAWQLYVQDDGAQRAKLEAFLDVHLDGAEPALARSVRAAFRALNGDSGPFVLPPPAAWQAHVDGWRSRLLAQTDLVSRLVAFAVSKS